MRELRREVASHIVRPSQEGREVQTGLHLYHHSGHGSVGDHEQRSPGLEPIYEPRSTPRGRSPNQPRVHDRRTPPREEILEFEDDLDP